MTANRSESFDIILDYMDRYARRESPVLDDKTREAFDYATGEMDKIVADLKGE